MKAYDPSLRRCDRVWPSRHGGVNLCHLRHGHASPRCVDTFANASCPTEDTEPSAWDRAMARKAARFQDS